MSIFAKIKSFFRRIAEKYDAWVERRKQKKHEREKEQYEWDKEHPHAARARSVAKEVATIVAFCAPVVAISVAAVALGITTDYTPPTTAERLQQSIDREVRLANQYDISTEERSEHMRLANDSLTALNRLQRMNSDAPDMSIKIETEVE